MSGALIPLMIIGSGVSVYGQYQQHRTAKEQEKRAKAQAKAQAAWHLYNSKLAQRQAEAERVASAFEVGQHKKKAEALLAKQRPLVGASGVEMVGSPLLVAEDTAAELAKEEVNLRITGQRRVSAYKSQSILDISKANAARTAYTRYDSRAGIINIGGSILQSAGQIAYMGSQMGGGNQSWDIGGTKSPY